MIVVAQTNTLATLALMTLRDLTGRVRVKSQVRVRAKEKVKMRFASNFNAFLLAFWLFGVLKKMYRKENITVANVARAFV